MPPPPVILSHTKSYFDISFGEIWWDLVHFVRLADLMRFGKILWDLAGFDDILWDSMRFGETECDLVRFSEIWWELVVNIAADWPFFEQYTNLKKSRLN